MKSIGSLLSPLALAITMSIGPQAHAQQSAGSESLRDTVRYLNEIIVIEHVGSQDAVIPAQTLSGKKLETLSANSVADAIRYFSGVQIKDYGGVGGIKTVDLRSMGTNHLGVFYDGIQLGNAQNGQIDLGKFSLDNIEEISLYNGQKSEIFQPARDFASAGTVYLRTRRPRFEDGMNSNLRLLLRTGSFGLINPSVLFEQRISSNITASLSAEYTRASGRYKFRYKKVFSDGTLAWDTTATRHNGDIHALRIEGAVFGQTNGGRWNAKVYYYDSEKGIPGAIVNNVWKNSQRQWDRNLMVQGSAQQQLSDHWQLQVNAKYARDYMRYLNPDTTSLYVDNEFWQDEIYISAASLYDIIPNFWKVSLAIDYQWNALDATLTDFANPVRHTVLAAVASAIEWRGIKVQGSIVGTWVNDKSTTYSSTGNTYKQNSHEYELTPAIFAGYTAIRTQYDVLSLRAFAKSSFRMPTFNDLYYTDIGNSALDPEHVNQYNFGLQYTHTNGSKWLLESFRISADAYYNHVTDKIIAVPKGNSQYRWMMMNIGRVKIRGIDVTAEANLHLPGQVFIDASLNYTYQRAEDYSDPTDNADEAGTYKGQIAYVPWHSGSAVAHVAWRTWDLNYSFIYVGERYQNSSNIQANYVQPWYTHDMTVAYSFTLGNIGFKLSGEINNIFDQQYEVVSNYPMPGRNFRLSICITMGRFK